MTYFPNAALTDNLASLSPQVGKVLIVDNGSTGQSVNFIERAAEKLDVNVVRLGSNLGIAAALNTGRNIAADQGYTWLATFDQDSQSTPHMVEIMARALASYPEPEKVAIITPRHIDQRIGHTVRERRHEAAGNGWRILFSTMTSGNLLNLTAASTVGGFDDALFIDLVDHEFCLRLRDHGYRVLEATDAVLLHSLGHMQRRRMLIKKVTITNHAPVRRYYMSRNRLIVWRRYWRRQPIWVLIDVRRFLSETVYMLTFEKEIWEKMRMVGRGIRHGIKNKGGPYKPKVR